MLGCNPGSSQHIKKEKASEISNKRFSCGPPMGWNSWNSLGFQVNEEDVLEAANYMADNLLKFGWEYVVIDAGWYFPESVKTNDNKKPNPPVSMDSFGRLIPDSIKFPSSKGGKGFRPLADKLHEKGLKFGIHIMRGIPWSSVQKNLPVFNSGYTARQFSYYENTCSWSTLTYKLNLEHPGSEAYYRSIINLYEEWGVDFIKVDDIARPYRNEEIELISKIINEKDREILLSLSPGPTPALKVEHVRKHADMWRISNDLWDQWNLVLRNIKLARQWDGKRVCKKWPDLDMLPLGKLRIYPFDEWVAGLIGDNVDGITNEYSRLSETEQLSLINFWCIFGSPLFMGGFLPENDSYTNKLLTNTELLNLNQASLSRFEMRGNDDYTIWFARDSVADTRYLACFNLTDKSRFFNISADEIGLKAKDKLIDLWNGEILKVDSGIELNILPHGSHVFKVKK
jgi:hypothetical protein